MNNRISEEKTEISKKKKEKIGIVNSKFCFTNAPRTECEEENLHENGSPTCKVKDCFDFKNDFIYLHMYVRTK